MSVMPIESRTIACPIKQKLQEHSSEIGSLSLVRTALKLQYEEADTELGDSLACGNEKLSEVKAQVGIPLSDRASVELFDAVSECLAKRYFGTCAVALLCKGRRDVDGILQGLGISRYKPSDEGVVS